MREGGIDLETVSAVGGGGTDRGGECWMREEFEEICCSYCSLSGGDVQYLDSLLRGGMRNRLTSSEQRSSASRVSIRRKRRVRRID